MGKVIDFEKERRRRRLTEKQGDLADAVIQLGTALENYHCGQGDVHDVLLGIQALLEAKGGMNP